MDQDDSQPKTVSLLVCFWSCRVSRNSNKEEDHGNGGGLETWEMLGNPVGGPEINAFMGDLTECQWTSGSFSFLLFGQCNPLFVYEYNPPSTQWQLRASAVPITGDNKASVCLILPMAS